MTTKAKEREMDRLAELRQLKKDINDTPSIKGRGPLLNKVRRFVWLIESYKYDEHTKHLMLKEVKAEFADLQAAIQRRDEERAEEKKRKDEERKRMALAS